MVLVTVAVAGIAMLVVGLSPWVLGTALALAVLGLSIGYTNIVAVSWLQARVAPDMVGRVMSLAMLMGFGITPLSLGIAGWLLDTDANVLFIGSGLLVVLTAAAAAVIRFPAQFDAPRVMVEGLPTG